MRDRIFCIDLTRRMVFLLGVYVRIVKVTDSTQVINFWEKANVKIHPRKADKNYRESMKLLFFFNTAAKQSLLSLVQHSTKNKKFFVLSSL